MLVHLFAAIETMAAPSTLLKTRFLCPQLDSESEEEEGEEMDEEERKERKEQRQKQRVRQLIFTVFTSYFRVRQLILCVYMTTKFLP
jgi:hypothetical protein